MSLRVVLESLQRRGGQATLKQLEEDHPLAGARCRTLVRQGYAERIAPGTYRLNERGMKARA